jgi:hypothetical protein
MDIWLEIMLYLDTASLLRLCSASRELKEAFQKAQYLWQCLYMYTFSDSPPEVFWLAAYRSRLAQERGIPVNAVSIDWQHAFFARKKTELNWCIGRGVQRYCAIKDDLPQIDNWDCMGFAPSDMVLWDRERNVYMIAATTADRCHRPRPISLDHIHFQNGLAEVFPISNVHPRVMELNDHGQRLFRSLYRSAQNPIGELLEQVCVILRRGRWAVCRELDKQGDEVYCRRWLLVDIRGQFPLEYLRILDVFEVHNDFDLDMLDETIEHDVPACPYDTPQDNVCVVAAHETNVTLCAIQYTHGTLRWVCFNVDYEVDQAMTSAETKPILPYKDPIAWVRAGRVCLNTADTSFEMEEALASASITMRALDQRYVLVQIGYSHTNYVYAVVLDATKSRSRARRLSCSSTESFNAKQETTIDANQTVRFQHGWFVRQPLEHILPLPHHRLLVLVQAPHEDDGLCQVQLRHFSNGQILKTYQLLPYLSMTWVLGDLFLVEARRLDEPWFLLLNAFTGEIVRKITGIPPQRCMRKLDFAPLYYVNIWEKAVSLVDMQSDTDATHQTWSCGFYQRVGWLDFMPELC